MHIILELAIVIIATKMAGDLTVRLGQPAVLGKLIVGILIGPAILGWIHDSHVIEVFSEIGVILLMFIAGLETNLEGLKKNIKSSTAVAVGGIVFPLVFGYLAGISLGMDQDKAVFLGLILSATSVSISVQTLKEMGQLQTKASTTLLGAAVLDDIIVVVLLAFSMSLFGGSDVNLGLVIGEKILFFGSIILISWKGIPLLMRLLSLLKITEPVISAGLVVCLFSAYYAELLGVAGIIGSFIGGIAISQTSFKEEVDRKIEPIAYTLFVPVFFVSIGLKVSFSGIGEHLWFLIGMTLLAIMTKFVGSGLGARMTGYDRRSSIGIGAGMISRGEVALIIASIGLDSKLLSQAYYTPLIIVIILTTLITPPLLKAIIGEKQQQAA
ncbi:sodium:proton antiporter [Terrilactibacillus sp. BCM23-1]|uniref:Sodium:proton antiporter n=1 Tax=Terrilactibacillus tamarindi TaxID=2599694 RepID=A0A6N8CL28_9BACI|nr:cation:proton antiporter [Terrilactibacillus tamarindi]MTT30542.1 sodium:proton antiporter [Terrilactibacillus tamarindi]